jgi:hypothetical protein
MTVRDLGCMFYEWCAGRLWTWMNETQSAAGGATHRRRAGLAAKRPYIMCRRLYEIVRAVRIAACGRVG